MPWDSLPENFRKWYPPGGGDMDQRHILDILKDKSIPPRRRAIIGLGGRCVAKTCRWHNDDGTTGCSDERALHFHHTGGEGSIRRQVGKDSSRSNTFEIIRHLKYGWAPRFELFCANCHEIETSTKGQRQGANQHIQPARIRRSQQVEGQPARRVRDKAETQI
jgi:hypothetical protein